MSSASAATVIWDQTPPDNLAFGVSDYDPLPSKDAQIGQYGDQFTLTMNQTITQIDWYGIYYIGNTPQPADNFTIRFFTYGNDNPGEPDINPFATYTVGSAVNRTDTGIDPCGTHDLYTYSAAIPNLALGPGEYLVSIVNNTIGDADDNWYWATYQENAGYQPPPALSYYRPTDGQVWQWNFSELAFRLLAADGTNGSAVPEGGATALLLGAALAGLFLGKRRLSST